MKNITKELKEKLKRATKNIIELEIYKSIETEENNENIKEQIQRLFHLEEYYRNTKGLILKEFVSLYINELAEDPIHILTNLQSKMIEVQKNFYVMSRFFNQTEINYIRTYLSEKVNNPQPQFGTFHIPYLKFMKEEFDRPYFNES